MGRHSKGSATSANDLVNFHFTTPAAPPSRAESRQGDPGSPRGKNRNSKHRNQTVRRTAEDLASARRKANSAMFSLHSSADHAFMLSRLSHSKVKSDAFSFSGCDNPVAWGSVLSVTQLMQANSELACPVCLCDFASPRITKCGHSFCLSCILRHVQTYTASNPYKHVKCPCCGIPLILDDLRPVIFRTVSAPSVQSRIRLIKLHRKKTCSAPFLPLPGEPKHSSPISAPTTGDNDANYTRFNYVNAAMYESLLAKNIEELRAQTELGWTDSVETGFLRLAIDMVLRQQEHQQQHANEENEVRKRYESPASGIYQSQSPYLLRQNVSSTQLEHSSHVESNENDAQFPVNAHGHAHSQYEVVSMAIAPQTGRLRGNSIGSYKSDGSHCEKSPSRQNARRPRSLEKYFGSMFIEDSEHVHFYQAEDGQLVFLSGFNMACLGNDYSKEVPSAAQGEVRPPFPDSIIGNVLDVEKVHLTPEMRKRMSFLSHLPLFTDVCFVELDLNHMLSDATRAKFKADFQKRRKRRQGKVQAEKKADRAAMQVEADRISERKARYQRVDPNDDFFQPSVSHTGPSVATASSTTSSSSIVASPPDGDSDTQTPDRDTGFVAGQPELSNTLNFSRACRRAENPLAASTQQDFPALGLPSTSNRPQWGNLKRDDVGATKPTVNTKQGPTATGSSKTKKKKGKAQKVLLFSTGGQRGGY